MATFHHLPGVKSPRSRGISLRESGRVYVLCSCLGYNKEVREQDEEEEAIMSHRMKIKIYYEDTDAAGVVYYANYLRFLERARTEFMLEHGIDVAEYHTRGFLFVITHVDIRYKRPAKLGETIEITTEIADRKNARIVLKSHIVRDGVLLGEAYVTFACLDREGKPRRFPEIFRNLPGAPPAA